jgi:acetyltransferase-like isoleucine patch superfamily enzyme
MIRWLSLLLFALKAKLRLRAKVSLAASIKFPRFVRLGHRCILRTGVIIDAPGPNPLVLGDDVQLNRGVYLGAFGDHFEVGPRTQFNRNALVDGRGSVRIGSDVMVGPGAQIISYTHKFDRLDVPIWSQGMEGREIVIGDDVWIGAGAIVLAGVQVGRGSIVGAGAVVTRSCPPLSILAGVPARVIGTRGKEPASPESAGPHIAGNPPGDAD